MSLQLYGSSGGVVNGNYGGFEGVKECEKANRMSAYRERSSSGSPATTAHFQLRNAQCVTHSSGISLVSKLLMPSDLLGLLGVNRVFVPSSRGRG